MCRAKVRCGWKWSVQLVTDGQCDWNTCRTASSIAAARLRPQRCRWAMSVGSSERVRSVPVGGSLEQWKGSTCRTRLLGRTAESGPDRTAPRSTTTRVSQHVPSHTYQLTTTGTRTVTSPIPSSRSRPPSHRGASSALCSLLAASSVLLINQFDNCTRLQTGFGRVHRVPSQNDSSDKPRGCRCECSTVLPEAEGVGLHTRGLGRERSGRSSIPPTLFARPSVTVKQGNWRAFSRRRSNERNPSVSPCNALGAACSWIRLHPAAQSMHPKLNLDAKQGHCTAA